jgi:hypothetical protein
MQNELTAKYYIVKIRRNIRSVHHDAVEPLIKKLMPALAAGG